MADSVPSTSSEVPKASAPGEYKRLTTQELLANKMEKVVKDMQRKNTGIPILKTGGYKEYPNVFTGKAMVNWLMNYFELTNVKEAEELCSRFANYGYVIPINLDNVTVKNDGSFYKFQLEKYWISKG